MFNRKEIAKLKEENANLKEEINKLQNKGTWKVGDRFWDMYGNKPTEFVIIQKRIEYIEPSCNPSLPEVLENNELDIVYKTQPLEFNDYMRYTNLADKHYPVHRTKEELINSLIDKE